MYSIQGVFLREKSQVVFLDLLKSAGARIGTAKSVCCLLHKLQSNPLHAIVAMSCLSQFVFRPVISGRVTWTRPYRLWLVLRTMQRVMRLPASFSGSQESDFGEILGSSV